MAELKIESLPELLGTDKPTILEIGANDGTDTERFLKTFPECRLYCFEPDRRAIHKWQARFAGKQMAKFVGIALSDNNAVATFHQSGGCPPNRPNLEGQEWDKSGSLCRPTGHLEWSPWCTFENKCQVITARLDTWMEHWPHDPIDTIDFIWLDVQGAERMVLQGATKTLPKVRFLYLECHKKEMYAGQPTVEELKAMLSDFECLGEYSENYLFRRKDDA